MDDASRQMACMEVWAGNQLTEQSVRFSGLDAWVYSRPHGAAPRGGDIVYASSCATGRITRLLLADVAGHGMAVDATATDLRALMRRFVNTLDQTELVRRLNKRFLASSLNSVFATALVTTFFAPTGRLTICNAGHPRPFLYRAARREWMLLGGEATAGAGFRNLPLGILSLSDYDQLDVQLKPGDIVLAYTDCLIEAVGTDGQVLGEEGLRLALPVFDDRAPAAFIPAVLDALCRCNAANLDGDDVTLLLLRASGREYGYSLGERFRAFGRFALSVLKALHPASERPPVPDLNVANVGGAVVPALGRRWRVQEPE